jgi:moderate conductance mechanosensitive channel
MSAPRTFSMRPSACFLAGVLLTLASFSSIAWAGSAAAAEPTVSVADLERLTQQIEDPQQRAQLLKTLQALIAVAKQGHDGVPPQEPPQLFSKRSRGLFFAFGELTQHVAAFGRRIGHGMATLPVMLAELPARFSQPETFWLMVYLALAMLILVALGLIFQLIAGRLESRLRARAVAGEPIPSWRKVWLALVAIGLAVAPYIALLIVSGMVFSILPVGAVASGLAALVISTLMLYYVGRAVALVMLDPETPSARLLSIGDSTAQQAWNWVRRLLMLAAAYLLITRALLTVGVDAELYRVVRGVMILVVASVLSALVWRLAQGQPTATAAAAPEDERRGLWPGVVMAWQKVWPIIAIAYVWCVAVLAILSYQQGMAFMIVASVQMAMVIGAVIALLWLSDVLFEKAAALNDRIGRSLPGLESRTRRYLTTLRWGLRVLIIVVGVLIILQVWGLGIFWVFTSPLGSDLLLRLITLIVTVAIVLFVMDLSSFVSRKLIEPPLDGVEVSKKRKTLVPLTAAVVKYATLFGGVLVALHQVGVNITPILAGVGILSLAVGFGAQTLVKDVINGLFILVEDSIAVGDVVTIRGTGGLVEAVNLRTVRLRDLQGNVHIIPNSQVETITNMTTDYSYYLLDVGVAYREDTDEVIAALQEIDAEMRADRAFAADMLEPIEILGVDRFTDSAVVIQARLKTKPIRQWFVGREFNRRMKKLFDARGIEIPFPHRTIYWGGPKRGAAAPLQLLIRNQEALASHAGQGEHQTATRHGGKADMQ